MSRYDVPHINNVRTNRWAHIISNMCHQIRKDGIAIYDKNEYILEFIREYILKNENRFFVIGSKSKIYIIDKNY